MQPGRSRDRSIRGRNWKIFDNRFVLKQIAGHNQRMQARRNTRYLLCHIHSCDAETFGAGVEAVGFALSVIRPGHTGVRQQ